MKYFVLVIAVACITLNMYGQKENFDVVSYQMPKGWDKIVTENGVQLSTKDDGKGNYAAVVIVKSITTTASPQDNFNDSWEKLVKGTVSVTEAPHTSDMDVEKGWTVLSGQANYTDGPNKGVATLLTATGGGKTVSVVLMTNTQQYQNELLAFINSLELKKIAKDKDNNAIRSANSNTVKITGLWCDNTLETSGYSNGFPQYTAGYFRKEYLFNENGTYVFRTKNWSVLTKNILFVHETGTYAVQGNQLIITPVKGVGEWWSKKDNNTKLWGNRLKASDYKSEKMTYNFEINYYSGTDNYSLMLDPQKSTVRDGAYNGPTSFSYSRRETGTSIIDNPPGFNSIADNKPPVSNGSTQAIENNSGSLLTGRIWEGTSTEKFSNAGGSSYNTGGFSTNQYLFNTDGSYRFVCVIASHYTDTKTLKYETGTYSINGNQLTIIPAKGYNEEWSKTGKTSNGNSDVSNRAINETWGKKLKTSPGKLEKYSYTFSMGKNAGKNALILNHQQPTERDGNGTTVYLNETPTEKSVKLPAMK